MNKIEVICNWCSWSGQENDLKVINDIEHCPACSCDGYLMDYQHPTRIKDVRSDVMLSIYMNQTGDEITSKNDLKHFSDNFQDWIEKVDKQVSRRAPADISLNKKSYLGKKTRALLKAMNIQEPKTLGILIGLLWQMHPEVNFYQKSI